MCDGLDEPGCSSSETTSTQPKPPEGYVVKWSRCSHFVEGDARIRNNSRVVVVASDGTVPIQRVEPVNDGEANFRRVVLAKLPNRLLGGEGLIAGQYCSADEHSAGSKFALSTSGAGARETRKKVSFVKLGQAVNTQETDGSVVQWVVGSEALGEPVKNENNGRLEYQDTCFRNPNLAGKDTAGYVGAEKELVGTCVVEDKTQAYNALSVSGYTPLINFATMKVATANKPSTSSRHPDGAAFLGFDGVSYNYTGGGAALNDINGAERDWTTAYIGGENYCHMIVSGGLEVPGAKRPATKSLPAPGIVNGKTFVVWRPVNPNVNIANEEASLVPDPVEPPPEPAPRPVDVDDAVVPM